MYFSVLFYNSIAEPVSELQKSYDQFLQRVELFKKKQLKLKVSRKFYFLYF